MMTTDERLAYMAGQILRNFATKGQEAAIEATLKHIVEFWDPGMKSRATNMTVNSDVALLEPVRIVFDRLGKSHTLDRLNI